MPKIIALLFLQMTLLSSLQATESPDTLTTKRTQYLGINYQGGGVFKTTEFLAQYPAFQSFSINYGFTLKRDYSENLAYNFPYYGIGASVCDFIQQKDLGVPFSIYAFSGATIHRFSPRIAINYEWNLGLSMGWKPYDPFENRDNKVIGSPNNVHVALKIYGDFYLSRYFDLRVGAALTHFSNGASRLPNMGVNMASFSVDLIYNIRRFEKPSLDLPAVATPKIAKGRIDHDVTALTSSRQKSFPTDNTGLPSPYVNRNFTVLGLSYAALFVPNYRYKWGPGLDLVYDESANARAWRELNPIDQKVYDRIALGKPRDRVSLGLSLHGEVRSPEFTIFAALGYNIIHHDSYDLRLYQILGIKVYLKDNFFGTFGIRANDFSQAQYLYWSLGYTFTTFRKIKIR